MRSDLSGMCRIADWRMKVLVNGLGGLIELGLLRGWLIGLEGDD